MHNATLLTRMRAEGIDPALLSPEELKLVTKASETEDFSLPPLPPCPLLHRADLSATVGQIAHAAQACLDAVSPCSPIMRGAQQREASAAAVDLGRAFLEFREEILCLLRENETQREELFSAVNSCRQQERQLICLHTAARISHRREDAAALATFLGRYEEETQFLTAALDRLEGEMEGLAALCEVYIPALLDTAAPLFERTGEETFSPTDYRAAALALRDACTRLMNRKEEL